MLSLNHRCVGVVFAIILGLFVWVSISNDEDDVDLISNIKAMLNKNDRVSSYLFRRIHA